MAGFGRVMNGAGAGFGADKELDSSLRWNDGESAGFRSYGVSSVGFRSYVLGVSSIAMLLYFLAPGLINSPVTE